MSTQNVYSPDYDNQGNPKDSIPQLKDAIENAVVDAENFASATGSFTDDNGNTFQKGAKGWAADAESFKNTAQTEASNASTSASNASDSATESKVASESATASAAAAFDFGEYADEAITFFADWEDPVADGTELINRARRPPVGAAQPSGSPTVNTTDNKIGAQSGDFEGATQDNYEIADNENLKSGGKNISFAAWMYPKNTFNNPLFSLWGPTRDERQITVWARNDLEYVLFATDQANNKNQVIIRGFNTKSWHFLTGYIKIKTSSFELGLSVNGGAFSTVSTSGDLETFTGPFEIGSTKEQGKYADALIDQFMFARGDRAMCLPDSKDWIYNSGNGRTTDEIRAHDFRVTATSITVDYPGDRQPFQRNSDDEGDVEVQISDSDRRLAELEARFNGGDWQSLGRVEPDRTLKSTFTGRAGQGSLEIRDAASQTILSTIQNVLVTDIYILLGQSNAIGSLNNSQPYNGGGLSVAYDGSDPGAGWQDMDNFVVGNGNNNVFPLIATKIFEKTGVPPALVVRGDGGTGFEGGEWVKGGTLYNDAVDTINNFAEINDAVAILWYQGENDAVLGNTTYKSDLSTFIDNFNQDIDIPEQAFLVSAIGPQPSATDAETNAIRQDQIKIWSDKGNVHPGSVAHGDIDSLHWVSDTEAEIWSEIWYRAIAHYAYDYHEDPRGPRIRRRTGISVSSDQIEIPFKGGEGQVFIQDASAWEVSDGNGSRTIQSVARSAGSIMLTVDQALSGTVSISFADGNNTDGKTYDSGAEALMPPEPIIDETVTV